MGDQRYPLHWPAGWPRTPAYRVKASNYQVSEARARDDLFETLRKMRARDVVVSTNVKLRLDGLPYANQRAPEDPGVAVYWTTRDGKSLTMACDRWRDLRSNYRAIGLALEGLRAMERAGVSELLDRAYRGFAALPAASAHSSWREVLDLHGEVTPDDVRRRARELARKHHPDRGGDAARMREVIEARDVGIAELEGGRSA